jgi:hypothetical protein
LNTKNAIEKRLKALRKDELNVLARKYRLMNLSSSKKETIIEDILENLSEKELRKELFQSSQMIIKLIGFLGAIASIVGFLWIVFPSGERNDQMDLVKPVEQQSIKQKAHKDKEVKVPKQLKLNEIDEFAEALSIPDTTISQRILENIKKIDEEQEMEQHIRQIIFDPTQTPHGPTEIADILSTLHVNGEKKLTAFVLKGKSFTKVTSRDVSHQFFKLRSIPGLELMILAAVGNIHDDAKRDFFQAAKDAKSASLIMNAHDLAKLFIAYKKICPQDGTSFDNSGVCREGHKVECGIRLEMEVGEKISYSIFQQKDKSFGGAKRFAAQILIDKHYSREILRKIIKELTEKLRKDTYCRDDLVKKRWGNSPAHVVWLDIGHSIEDIIRSNWSCQSLWVDPLLEKESRPGSLFGDEIYENIEVLWNDNYKKMDSLLEAHSGTKNEVLTVLFKLLDQMIPISDNVIKFFGEYSRDYISENNFIQQMQQLEPKIDRIYRESGHVPLPPHECKDFYQACQNVFADFHNMSLYYSETSLEQWPSRNRYYLMKSTIKRFLDELKVVKFERKKLE